MNLFYRLENENSVLHPVKILNGNPCIRESSEVHHYSLGIQVADDYVPDIISVSNNSESFGATVDVECNVEGKRIIHFSRFMEQLKKISVHHESTKLGCSFKHLFVLSELKKGLNSVIKLKCQSCKNEFTLYTCDSPYDNDKMNINYCGVLGTLLAGNGFVQYSEFFANLEIPTLSESAYKNYHDSIAKDVRETAIHTMKAAADEEKKIARDDGSFDDEGELITVITDGCWSKRSYGNSYNALSGSATIIGNKTKKVLWSGIRNKYCVSCCRGLEHTCSKNFDGPSTGMESDILVEGFSKSLELYGLKYHTFIADGDSSVHKRINDSFPYKEKVKKLECRNHLLRNLRKKIKEVAGNTKYNISARKKFTTKSQQICRAIYSSIHHWKDTTLSLTLEERILKLQADLINIPRHIFGNHKQCAEYYASSCNKTETNIYDEIRFDKSGIFEKITTIMESVSSKANSLIHDVDSNIVEHFHSIVGKYVGGKRINFSLANSYEARTYIAVIHHNTSGAVNSAIQAHIFKRDAPEIVKRIENKKITKNTKRISKKKKFRVTPGKMDKNYGTDTSSKATMSEAEIARAKLFFLEELKDQQKNRFQIYKNTIDQANSALWNNTRKKLITSSNFGLVCKRRKSDCTKLVANLLSNKHLTTAAINHGKISEEHAIRKLERTLNIQVDSCGLVIDAEYAFIGSSPDGLIGDDGCVEIKCPYKSFGRNIDEGIVFLKIIVKLNTILK